MSQVTGTLSINITKDDGVHKGFERYLEPTFVSAGHLSSHEV